MVGDSCNKELLTSSLPPQAKYQHTPLPREPGSFRLVKVSPSGDDTVPSCEIVEANIDREKNKYYALSYLWGRDEPSFEIRIGDKVFNVRENLYRFLLCARLRFSNKPFFIDAICIDQSNISERNQQVQMMGNIYLYSDVTICWLGDGSPEIESALSFMAIFSRVSRPLLDEFFRNREQHIRENIWNCVYSLLDLEYWTRTWIVQEMMKPYHLKLMHGQKIVEWSRIAEFFMNLSPSHPYPAPNEDKILSSRLNKFQADRGSIPSRRRLAYQSDANGARQMQDILLQYSRTSCSETRDRIFAMLSLGKGGQDLTVDYAITVDELLLSATRLWGAQRGKNALYLAKHLAGLLERDRSEICYQKDPENAYFLKFEILPETTDHSSCQEDGWCSAKRIVRYRVPRDLYGENGHVYIHSSPQDGVSINGFDGNSGWNGPAVKAFTLEADNRSQLLCTDEIAQIVDTSMFLGVRSQAESRSIISRISVTLQNAGGRPKFVSRGLSWPLTPDHDFEVQAKSKSYLQIPLYPGSFRQFLDLISAESRNVRLLNVPLGQFQLSLLPYLRWVDDPVDSHPLSAVHAVDNKYRFGYFMRGSSALKPVGQLSVDQIYQALNTLTLDKCDPKTYVPPPMSPADESRRESSITMLEKLAS